jgi:hypothetical protein
MTGCRDAHMDSAMRLKPDLQLYVAMAQAIVDQAVSVATVSKLALPSLASPLRNT